MITGLFIVIFVFALYKAMGIFGSSRHSVPKLSKRPLFRISTLINWDRLRKTHEADAKWKPPVLKEPKIESSPTTWAD